MKVISIRFKAGGKSYFFDPGDIELHKDDHCIVETSKGIEYATVASEIQDVDEGRIVSPLKKVMRKATEADDRQVEDNIEKEKNAYRIAQEKIASHGLDMKLTDVEYAFDNSKIIFFFVAEQRVDFRELVKDLAAVFRTRIELRQIGVRDEARNLGGFGFCGRPLCCAEFLSDFVPVSIKMAKEQNLSLNPTKISGVCGRLMCCLKYEEEAYEELNATMPALGDYVATSDGCRGEVSGINVLRQMAKVLVEIGDEKELRDYPAADITVLRRKKGKRNGTHASIAAEDSPEMLALLEDEARDRRDEAERAKSAGDRTQNNQGGNNPNANSRKNDRKNEKNNDRNSDRNGDKNSDKNAEKGGVKNNEEKRDERMDASGKNAEGAGGGNRQDKSGNHKRHGRHGKGGKHHGGGKDKPSGDNAGQS